MFVIVSTHAGRPQYYAGPVSPWQPDIANAFRLTAWSAERIADLYRDILPAVRVQRAG